MSWFLPDRLPGFPPNYNWFHMASVVTQALDEEEEGEDGDGDEDNWGRKTKATNQPVEVDTMLMVHTNNRCPSCGHHDLLFHRPGRYEAASTFLWCPRCHGAWVKGSKQWRHVKDCLPGDFIHNTDGWTPEI